MRTTTYGQMQPGQGMTGAMNPRMQMRPQMQPQMQPGQRNPNLNPRGMNTRGQRGQNQIGRQNIKQTRNNRNANNANNNNANNNAQANTPEGIIDRNISSYKTIIIILIIIMVLCIIGYFVSFSYRESKGLYNVFLSKEYLFIDSKVNTRENRNKKLCDFYITSAYRPYMVINQKLDYCSLEMMKAVLMSGVRCVYLDIFNSTLNENAYPIVTTGIKQGEWKLGLNSLLFEDVCVLISSIVFSNGYVNNFRDPFILCLNLNTNGNVKCLNKIKKTLYKVFRSKLLPNDYTYGRQNIPEIPIHKLLDKVIIFTSDGYQNSQLEELVNFSWDKDELNKISYKSLDPQVPDTETVKYNTNELKDYNKNNLTMVMPDESSWFTYNYDTNYAIAAGCQLVFVNYNKLGPEFDSYLTRFKNDSFLPKPVNMISVTNSEVENMELIVMESQERDKDTTLNCPEDQGINSAA